MTKMPRKRPPCSARRPTRSATSTALAFFLASSSAGAWEAFEARPGTRAMGMAGVFSAQADDSSAWWYNPAGPRHRQGIHLDASLEWGQVPGGTIGDDTPQAAGYDDAAAFSFAGLYYAGLPFAGKSPSWGTGIAYFRPYETQVYVDAPRSLVDAAPFGRINAVIHQASVGLSRNISPGFTVGSTADLLWSEIDCLEFSPCVDNGPAGWGTQLGVLYDLMQHEERTITLGATWRSKASLGYDSTPRSGLGTVLESYLPDRPMAASISLSVQTPTSHALLRTNAVVEKKRWTGADGATQPLADYLVIGASGESLFVIGEGQTLALRVGLRHARANDEAADDVNVAAAGVGYGFGQRHALDVAAERRDSGRHGSATLWSVSYSLQY